MAGTLYFKLDFSYNGRERGVLKCGSSLACYAPLSELTYFFKKIIGTGNSNFALFWSNAALAFILFYSPLVHRGDHSLSALIRQSLKPHNNRVC